MKIAEFVRKAHSLIEAKLVKRISQAEMGKILNVSGRAYGEYVRGGNSPKAMRALLNLLAQLDEEDVLKVIKAWKGEGA